MRPCDDLHLLLYQAAVAYLSLPFLISKLAECWGFVQHL